MRFAILLFLASPAAAASFDRPVPNAQSATAELWFALASIALVLALVAVARVIAKR